MKKYLVIPILLISFLANAQLSLSQLKDRGSVVRPIQAMIVYEQLSIFMLIRSCPMISHKKNISRWTVQ